MYAIRSYYAEIQENQARALRVTDFVRKGLSLDVLVEGVNQVAQQPVRKPHAPVGPVSDTGETILVVDDEQLVRDLVVQFLGLRGYCVTGVKDGRITSYNVCYTKLLRKLQSLYGQGE